MLIFRRRLEVGVLEHCGKMPSVPVHVIQSLVTSRGQRTGVWALVPLFSIDEIGTGCVCVCDVSVRVHTAHNVLPSCVPFPDCSLHAWVIG
jgi:acid phosphatase family membrane protein YuiD